MWWQSKESNRIESNHCRHYLKVFLMSFQDFKKGPSNRKGGSAAAANYQPNSSGNSSSSPWSIAGGVISSSGDSSSSTSRISEFLTQYQVSESPSVTGHDQDGGDREASSSSFSILDVTLEFPLILTTAVFFIIYLTFKFNLHFVEQRNVGILEKIAQQCVARGTTPSMLQELEQQ